ncbi:hypothetical protein LVS37_03290, partial [Klebsiella pneumoniae]|nr:hypothetical protein [Klebsiella pneumoniae]
MGKDNIYGPGESFSRGMEIGKTTIFRQNRPVKFRLEMVNGSVVEGIWICPYISRHLLSLNPLLARCRRYSRG